MVSSFGLRPDLPSCNGRGKQVVNLDSINNQASSLSQNIYFITNLLITNNYSFEMIRKTIFTNYVSVFTDQVAIKYRFIEVLQKKCFQSDIIFTHYAKMPPIKL